MTSIVAQKLKPLSNEKNSKWICWQCMYERLSDLWEYMIRTILFDKLIIKSIELKHSTRAVLGLKCLTHVPHEPSWLKLHFPEKMKNMIFSPLWRNTSSRQLSMYPWTSETWASGSHFCCVTGRKSPPIVHATTSTFAKCFVSVFFWCLCPRQAVIFYWWWLVVVYQHCV